MIYINLIFSYEFSADTAILGRQGQGNAGARSVPTFRFTFQHRVRFEIG